MELEGKVTKGVGLRNGRDNNRGFRNGLTNGFTNGHGYSNGRNGRKLKESRSHGKVLAIFVFAMLVVSVVAVLTWQSKSAGTIRIDGRFEDWQGIAKCTKPRNDSVPANIDIAEYASADFGRNVAFYAEVHGSFLAGDGSPATETVSEPNVSFATQRETAIPNVNGRDVAYVFVDTDNNPATGFKPSQNFAVGADKAIEIVGKNGKIEASRVLTFAGVVQQEWTWNIGESVDAATNGKEMETMAGKGVLGIGESYAVYFYMIDWNGNKGMVDNAFRSENAKVSMSGLYLNSHAIARAKSMGMEVKGTSHAPIHINGNDDFANQAANEGWPGDGSEGNPYIIDGLEIDANGGTYGIWIENTDVYFVIRNCTVYSATSSGGVPYGTGIALNNVTHATLESNKCNNSTYGIFLYGGSQYNTITNNNASGNSDCGICLFESSNNNITNNNASGNSYFGILLSSSSNNNITNNNASGNSHNGIYLWYSSNNNITTNILWENGIVIWGDRLEHWNTHTIDTSNLVNGKPVYYYKNQDGGTVPADAGQVILANCSNMVVSGLSISNASIGIQLGFSNYNTITNNNASGNSRYGIYLWHSSNNTVTNNTASGNSECGIHLDYSSNNNITNNNASGNSYFGIYLWHSNNNITNNNASGNYYCGISLHYYSSNNTITNNNASNNSYYGIYLCDSSNNNITNNNASGNSWIGIYLDSSSNNIITYNWICNTVYYGVYITGGSTGNTIHHNNFIGNNGAGKGVNGSCQAYDSVGGNYWYDNSVNEGNYWSNWDHSGAYPIDGGAGASDPYPLVNPVAEFSSMPLFMLALASLLILARVRKPHKHS